jgi:uncharacterized repeat protein (TIGR03803 family)
MIGIMRHQLMILRTCVHVLYTVALEIVLAAAILAQPLQAQTYTLLHSFKNQPDGAYPQAGLILDGSGNFYGTTYEGGVGYGTVFKGNSAGRQTTLYSFKSGTDGEYPLRAGVILDGAGNLYGTTYTGGVFDYGTVFKLDTAGHETVLHSFAGSAADGTYPYAGVTMDSSGNLYGTTAYGGGISYGGIVFKLDTTGKETVLYAFGGTPDGAFPFAPVSLDKAGNLYGTTYGGGSAGLGAVFKVDTAGQETVLYSFGGTPDGAAPYAGVTLDSAGNLYGATYDGGASNDGTVFKLDTSGQETVLYSFTGTGGDGAHPYAGVILDSSGNLYGTTYAGGDLSCGTQGCGTVFELDTSGQESVLHTFEGFRGKFIDGSWPFAGVVRDAAGNLYGTTNKGGKYTVRVGTVFKLTP